MLDTAYTARYTKTFPVPGRISHYDSTIADDAKQGARAKAESKHNVKKADYNMYLSACRETIKFILAIVEDTWVRELRDPDIFYAAVLPRNLLDHLQLSCGGLHVLDVLALQNDMQRFHLDAKGMPEYTNTLEDTQMQSRRGNHDITDATLLLMATNDMLVTQRFPRANKRWEGKTFQAKTWSAWKKLYKEADHQAKISRIAAGGKDQFGAAHEAGSAGYAPSPP